MVDYVFRLRNVRPARYRQCMVTLEDLKARVDDLTDMVRVTDSVAVKNDQLLRAQTSLMMAMRKDLLGITAEQKTIKGILTDQAEALGGMIITLSQMQPTVARLEGHVASMDRRFDRLELRQDGADARLDRMEQRQDRMDGRLDGIDGRLDGIDGRLDGMDGRFDRINGRLDGMDGRLDGIDGRLDGMGQQQGRLDRNVEAIMRHLGVEPDPS